MRLTSRIYPTAVVHGPYLDKTIGRMVVNIQIGKARRNMTFARFLMQEGLGRELLPNEHVDHKNDNKLDDRVNNLQLLTPAANTRKSKGEITWYEFTCPVCGGPGTQDARQVRHNRNQGKAGPFCGKSCAGRYKPR